MKRAISLVLVVITGILSVVGCGQKAPTWQEQYDLGVRYLSEDNYEEAIIAFTAAIEIDPKRAPAYVGRGDAYVLSGETEENLVAAQADYKEAIALDETLAEAYLGLANIYILQENYDNALEILQKGLDITGAVEIEESLLELQIMSKCERMPDDTIVEWDDVAFEKLIRQLLQKPEGNILVEDLNDITALAILGDTHVYTEIASETSDWGYAVIDSRVEGLGAYYITGIKSGDSKVYTQRGTIKSVDALQYFQNIEAVEIVANQISDVSVLRTLPRLKWANFFANMIEDLSPFDGIGHPLNQYQFIKIGDPIGDL